MIFTPNKGFNTSNMAWLGKIKWSSSMKERDARDLFAPNRSTELRRGFIGRRDGMFSARACDTG